MTTYTVHCEYAATGEGITHMIWMGFCEHEQDALLQFTKCFGEWYAQGAEISPGFCFENMSAQLLVSDATKQILTDPEGYKSFHAQLHVNYS